ncbi:Alpha/Beta hydrolase protein [Xylariales sp. AK1849]|nr:Alpha/Beta hydrolase protein [Xylariales sp. AK1849]
MFALISLVVLLVFDVVVSESAGNLNFHATFGDSPTPFNIRVDQRFIEETTVRASLTRFVVEFNQTGLVDGPRVCNASTIADYWVNDYDWPAVEDALNKDRSNYADAVPLHFVHHRSHRKDAIPLLFIHGWPGSFLEIGPLMNFLTHPPNDSVPAFHVVAPSIPEFAFSPAPANPGYGYIEAAHSFEALMQQLGYNQYVIQGGDAGGIIMRYQAYLYPKSVISGLNNFCVVSPSVSDMQRYYTDNCTADERYVIELHNSFIQNSWAYGHIQQTRPLRLAHAMTDSPVGLAMWIYDALWPAVWDRSVWTPKEIITWTMIHWIQGPYAAFSIYKEGAQGGTFNLTHFFDLPFVTQLVAMSDFPKDLWYRTPIEWAERSGNVKVRYLHEIGGHFPAWENPDLLLEDIWAFFGDLHLSNTRVFRN